MRSETSDSDTQATSATARLDAIVDAVCQGRLTPADVAGLSPDELEAIYAMGQMRFESGQIEQAVAMWAALVSLDPYQARAWRALGIGHHHSGAMRQAGAAYAAALYLEPGHALVAAYAAEVHLLLGEQTLAEHYARIVHRHADSQATERLSRLWTNAAVTPAPVKTSDDALGLAPPAAHAAAMETAAFCLLDGRTLPLADSSYAPAGETDETTLVYDLAQAAAMPRGGERKATQDKEAASPDDDMSSMAPPLLAVEMPAFVPPKERTVTGLSQNPPRILPEATAARRMGRMLTEEITISPDLALDEEITQAHLATTKEEL